MKRRHLVVLVSAFTLLAVIFVLAVMIGVGVGTDPGREQIVAMIQSQFAGRIHGKLHIGKVSGNVLTGFTLDTFAIRGLDDSLLVSTGRISLEYDPRDLIDRRVLVRNVQVEHPVLRLQQYAKGDWNFQRIFKSSRGPTPNVPGRSFGDFIVMDSVHVRDAQVILVRAWQPDDSLRGAKRDSAIRVNLASKTREIRRSSDGYTHTYRWSNATGFLPHIRLAHPDSDRFGQEFVIGSMRVDEQEPPFNFRNTRGVVRHLGDSVFVSAPEFALPASHGSATAKIWWGSGLPIRLDIRIRGDSVSMSDVAWIYPTLPRSGGGRADVHIYNNHDNLHAFEYAISNMDVQSTRSRLQGAMTFGVGGPVLTVRDVNLRANPVNFDLLRTLAGGPFPTDWQGDLYGFAQGPGGPLTHFVVDQSDLTWRDTHVRGAVSRFGGSGELDILYPAYTIFHGFKVNVASLDLRSIEYLFPSFPRIHGAASGTAVLDSSWMDVRFSNANVFHRFGPGDPSHVTGSGRVTYGEQFMTYDVNVTAQPVSLTMLSRAYPLGLRGLFNGPIQVKGQSDSMQLAMDLTGPAGRITYSGFVDAYPLSVAARGTGRVERLDPSLLVAKFAVPSGALTGNYQLDVRGDTSDLATLAGNATVLLERSDFDGLRLSPSRVRARFADGRVYLDTVRVESVAGVFSASGALGLSPAHPDSLHYEIVVDTLGGLRRYITPFLSSWAQPANVATVDSLAGTVTVTGVLRGSVQRVDVAGQVQGRDLYVRRDAGKHVTGSFALSDIMTGVRGTAAVRFDAVSLGGIAMDSLAASVRFDQPRSGQFSIGAQSTNGVRFTTLGDVALTDSGSTMRVRDLALVAEGGSQWRLAGPADIATRGRGIAIDSLVLVNGAGGRVALQGGVPDSGKAKFLFRADSVALSDIGRVAQLTRPLEGWAHITAQGAGTNDAPVVNVQTQLADVRYGGVHLERVNATAAYANRRADVTLNLGSGGRTALLANGQLPLEIRYFGARLLDDSLHASVRTDSASFDIVEALLPGLRDATGNLTANLTVAGTWKHPDLAGGLRVDNGEVTVDPLGVRMKGVNVDVALFGHSDSLAIRRIVGWSGTNASDSLSLHGYVAYRDVEDPYLSLVLNARTFHALDKRSLARLDVSTEAGGVRLRGRLHGATLTGGLVVDRGTIFLPDPQLARKQVVDLTSQFADTLEATRQLVPTPPSNVLESLIIDGVRVTLGDDVWLRSDEANIKLVGTLNVQRGVRRGALVGADSLKPVLEGELRAERGTYTLTLGPAVQREFQVEGGTITFVPDPDEVAQLNISALHTVHTVRNENKADIRIRVRLTGPLYPNPIVTLESAESFPLSQSDAVSYLIFGQPNFELGTQDQSYVQVAVQTIYPTLQTVAQSSLRNVLGPWADIVQVRPGSSDASNFEQNSAQFFNDVFWTSRLGAEKQLTENVYVSLSTGICQLRPSNSQTSDQWLDFYNGLSGKIEWRLSENSSLKAGKEPSGLICNRSTSGRLLPTPSQWGLSLFKTWRF